jgi:hypothetical protein
LTRLFSRISQTPRCIIVVVANMATQGGIHGHAGR